MFHLVLFQPEIPHNTGALIRLCAHTGSCLHLIAPLGFALTEKRLRRAGLDYSATSTYQVHQDFACFIQEIAPPQLYFFLSRATTSYTDMTYQRGAALVFGSETKGLTRLGCDAYPTAQHALIPMQPGGRCLNLAIAASLANYEAWRQQQFALV